MAGYDVLKTDFISYFVLIFILSANPTNKYTKHLIRWTVDTLAKRLKIFLGGFEQIVVQTGSFSNHFMADLKSLVGLTD
jgi:hypothetical protein